MRDKNLLTGAGQMGVLYSPGANVNRVGRPVDTSVIQMAPALRRGPGSLTLTMRVPSGAMRGKPNASDSPTSPINSPFGPSHRNCRTDRDVTGTNTTVPVSDTENALPASFDPT